MSGSRWPTRERSITITRRKTHARWIRFDIGPVNLNDSNRDRNKLGVGIALVVLADLVLAITAGGGGGLFVWPLVTWPLAVLGGVVTGDAVE